MSILTAVLETTDPSRTAGPEREVRPDVAVAETTTLTTEPARNIDMVTISAQSASTRTTWAAKRAARSHTSVSNAGHRDRAIARRRQHAAMVGAFDAADLARSAWAQMQVVGR